MLVPYPNDFPTAALSMVLDKLRGQPVPTADLVHGAWNVAGYALGQALPTEAVVGAPFGSDIELLEYAIAEGAPTEGDNGITKGAIPWVLILRLVLNLILQESK